MSDTEALSKTTRATKISRTAALALAAVGMGISGYLSFASWLGEEPVCFGSSGCGHVLTSDYSQIWGVPLSLLGLAMYGALAVLSIIVMKQRDKSGTFADLGIYTVALAGTLYSACLTMLQFWVLHSVCIWCLTSALVVTAIFLLSLGGLFKPYSPNNKLEVPIA